VESYYPTIENTFSKTIKYKNEDYLTEIVDTAGQVSSFLGVIRPNLTRFEQDEYSILQSKHFIGIHGYMIVYSVGSRQSFEMVRTIRDKIMNHLVS
jgi:Ras family protein